MNLVFFPLEPAEESTDAVITALGIVSGPVDHESLFVVREFFPGHVQTDAPCARRFLEFRELCAVMRLAPRLDCAVLNRLRRIGHDEIDVELDDVAEPVARGTRAEWVVEREQSRLRIFVGDAAGAALEPLGEQMRDGLGTRGWGLGA